MWTNRYFKRLTHRLFINPPRCFIRVKQNQKFKVQVDEIIDLKSYYEDILRFSYLSERGTQIIDSSHLQNMVTFSQTADDLQFTIDAYYNFLGHYTKFEDIVLDNLCLKAIQLDCPNLIFDIIENHNYLGYYPHTDVLEKLVANLIQKNDIDNLSKISQIILNKVLIKKSAQLCAALIDFFTKNDDKLGIHKTIAIIKQQGLKMDDHYIKQINQVQLHQQSSKKSLKDIYRITTLDTLDYLVQLLNDQIQKTKPVQIEQLLNKVQKVHQRNKHQQLDQKQFQQILVGLRKYCQNNQTKSKATSMLTKLKTGLADLMDQSTHEVLDQSIIYVQQNCMNTKEFYQILKQKKIQSHQQNDDSQQDQDGQQSEE